jgi:hypothetical protein
MPNVVCALPGCPTLIPDSYVSFTDGYCETHLLVAVVDRLKALEENVERIAPSAGA